MAQLELFIKKSKEKHNSFYDYSLVEYNTAKIKITCKKHGVFEQSPTNHLSGQGCIKCNISKSRPEIKWLDMLAIEEKFRQHIIVIQGKKFKVDACKDNIIYEFLGDYWHGNPDKFDLNLINRQVNKYFGELYKCALERIQLFEDNGYTVEFIWENDFRNRANSTGVKNGKK